MYYILSLTFFLFLEITIVLTQGNDCHLKNGAIGMCIPYNQCDDRLIESRFGTPSIPVSCDNEKICCRHASTAIVNEACKYYIKKKSMITPQILRGTDVAMGEYPHMAALGYYKDTGLTFDCGGTLISETFVLTAAHCIFNKNDKQPSLVRMGTIILNGTFDTSSTDYNISEIITHHYYNRLRRINDIALLRLVRPVKLSTTIFPACLETSHVVPSVDATPMVAGWGNTVAKGDAYSNTLLKTSLKFVNDRECSEILSNGPSFRKHFPLGILRTQLCAKGNISDTCQGDSGGPLKVPYENIQKVIGVTSFGTICGSSVPGVYTKVSAYLTWISKIVWPQGFQENEDDDY